MFTCLTFFVLNYVFYVLLCCVRLKRTFFSSVRPRSTCILFKTFFPPCASKVKAIRGWKVTSSWPAAVPGDQCVVRVLTYGALYVHTFLLCFHTIQLWMSWWWQKFPSASSVTGVCEFQICRSEIVVGVPPQYESQSSCATSDAKAQLSAAIQQTVNTAALFRRSIHGPIYIYRERERERERASGHGSNHRGLNELSFVCTFALRNLICIAMFSTCISRFTLSCLLSVVLVRATYRVWCSVCCFKFLHGYLPYHRWPKALIKAHQQQHWHSHTCRSLPAADNSEYTPNARISPLKPFSSVSHAAASETDQH